MSVDHPAIVNAIALGDGTTSAGWILVGVAVVTLLEDSVGLGVVLPAETVVVSAGAAAAHDLVPLWAVLLVAWVCGTAGDSIGFGVGRRWGRRLIESYGDRVGLTAERFKRADSFIARWGVLGVAGGRLVPGMRILVMPTAGASALGWHTFVVADLVGVAVWATLHVTAGYLLGLGVSRVDNDLVAVGAAVVVCGVVVGWLLHRWLSRRKGETNCRDGAGGG